MTYNEKVKRIVELSDKTPPEIAIELGVSYSTIRAWQGLDNKKTSPGSVLHKRAIDALYNKLTTQAGG
jgi:hypothetical protein